MARLGLAVSRGRLVLMDAQANEARPAYRDQQAHRDRKAVQGRLVNRVAEVNQAPEANRVHRVAQVRRDRLGLKDLEEKLVYKDSKAHVERYNTNHCYCDAYISCCVYHNMHTDTHHK